MRNVLMTAALGYFAKLRFPTLVMLTGALFAINLVVPDVLPFVDEILLGLLTLMLAALKRKPQVGEASAGNDQGQSPRPPIDVTPTRGGRSDTDRERR